MHPYSPHSHSTPSRCSCHEGGRPRRDERAAIAIPLGNAAMVCLKTPLGSITVTDDPACAGCLIACALDLDQVLLDAPGIIASVQLCTDCRYRFSEGERRFLVARAIRAAEVTG